MEHPLPPRRRARFCARKSFPPSFQNRGCSSHGHCHRRRDKYRRHVEEVRWSFARSLPGRSIPKRTSGRFLHRGSPRPVISATGSTQEPPDRSIASMSRHYRYKCSYRRRQHRALYPRNTRNETEILQGNFRSASTSAPAHRKDTRKKQRGKRRYGTADETSNKSYSWSCYDTEAITKVTLVCEKNVMGRWHPLSASALAKLPAHPCVFPDQRLFLPEMLTETPPIPPAFPEPPPSHVLSSTPPATVPKASGISLRLE